MRKLFDINKNESLRGHIELYKEYGDCIYEEIDTWYYLNIGTYFLKTCMCDSCAYSSGKLHTLKIFHTCYVYSRLCKGLK